MTRSTVDDGMAINFSHNRRTFLFECLDAVFLRLLGLVFKQCVGLLEGCHSIKNSILVESATFKLSDCQFIASFGRDHWALLTDIAVSAHWSCRRGFLRITSKSMAHPEYTFYLGAHLLGWPHFGGKFGIFPSHVGNQKFDFTLEPHTGIFAKLLSQSGMRLFKSWYTIKGGQQSLNLRPNNIPCLCHDFWALKSFLFF